MNIIRYIWCAVRTLLLSLRAKRGNPLLVVLCLVLLATGIAIASDGTVNKTVREQITVTDSYGRPRADCKLSLFSVDRMYRDGARITPPATTFRNVTSAGSYTATYTPAVAGEYKCMLNYSGVNVGTFTRTVSAYDVDTAYSGLSGQLLAIPTNPLLATDPRVPATVMATSVEVAKAASLTAHDAEVKAAIAAAHAVTDAKLDGIDDDPWDNPGRTVTGGIVDEAATVTGLVGLTAEAAAGIDSVLTGSHGTGLWSAAGTVTVVPFQGTVSYETATRSADVHVVRGDSAGGRYGSGQRQTPQTTLMPYRPGTSPPT